MRQLASPDLTLLLRFVLLAHGSCMLCSYSIMGDGCNMEGVTNEAASLAGHWGLGKLIVFYDDNKVSPDTDWQSS